MAEESDFDHFNVFPGRTFVVGLVGATSNITYDSEGSQ